MLTHQANTGSLHHGAGAKTQEGLVLKHQAGELLPILGSGHKPGFEVLPARVVEGAIEMVGDQQGDGQIKTHTKSLPERRR